MKITRVLVLFNIIVGLPVVASAAEDLLIFDSGSASARPDVISSRPTPKQVSSAPVQIGPKPKAAEPLPPASAKPEDGSPRETKDPTNNSTLENPTIDDSPDDEKIDAPGDPDYATP